MQLHGGYRRDFLSLDPAGFRVEVRAPRDTTAPGGAAMEIRGAGARETIAERNSFTLDAPTHSGCVELGLAHRLGTAREDQVTATGLNLHDGLDDCL